jgi:hypothetical protein
MPKCWRCQQAHSAHCTCCLFEWRMPHQLLKDILQVAADGNAASGKGRPTDEAERIIGAMLQGRYLALDFGYTGAACSCCTSV